MTEPIVTIAVSHNNRIQQFLKAIFGIVPLGKEKIRFLNCAVLKIKIAPNSDTTVELLYSGDTASAKKEKVKSLISRNTVYELIDYYVNDDIDKATVGNFNPIVFAKKGIPKSYNNNEKHQIIYLVRHGLAFHNSDTDHNIKGGTGLFLDSSLTLYGFLGAIDSAIAIMKDMNTNRFENIQFLMASDLIRSRQTLATIYNTMIGLNKEPTHLLFLDDLLNGNNDNSVRTHINHNITQKIAEYNHSPNNLPKINLNKDLVIFVVPCLNEIPSAPIALFYAQHGMDIENFRDSKYDPKKDNIVNISGNIGVHVNWKYYLEFYGGKIRSIINYNCPENTDIIEKMLEIISEETSISPETIFSKFANNTNYTLENAVVELIANIKLRSIKSSLISISTTLTDQLRSYQISTSATTKINPFSDLSVFDTPGDGSCLIHSLLISSSPTYRRLNTRDMQTCGKAFRRNIFSLIYLNKIIAFMSNNININTLLGMIDSSKYTYDEFKDQIYKHLKQPDDKNNYDFEKLLESAYDAVNPNFFLEDSNIMDIANHFNVNILVIVLSNDLETTPAYRIFYPGISFDNIYDTHQDGFVENLNKNQYNWIIIYNS